MKTEYISTFNFQLEISSKSVTTPFVVWLYLHWLQEWAIFPSSDTLPDNLYPSCYNDILNINSSINVSLIFKFMVNLLVIKLVN
jgi:hypothetical protein